MRRNVALNARFLTCNFSHTSNETQIKYQNHRTYLVL